MSLVVVVLLFSLFGWLYAEFYKEQHYKLFQRCVYVLPFRLACKRLPSPITLTSQFYAHVVPSWDYKSQSTVKWHQFDSIVVRSRLRYCLAFWSCFSCRCEYIRTLDFSLKYYFSPHRVLVEPSRCSVCFCYLFFCFMKRMLCQDTLLSSLVLLEGSQQVVHTFAASYRRSYI